MENYIRSHPLRAGVIAALALMILTLPWLYLPKTVSFSYAGETCVGELTLMPRLQSEVYAAGYSASFMDQITVGSYPVAATKVCFEAVETPEPGDVKIATAILGSWIGRQQYKLQIGEQPKVDVAALEQPVPTTKPLSVALDQPDILHRYALSVDKKTTNCDSTDAELLCDIERLSLSQGKQYDYELTKSFDDEEDLTVNAGTLKTLKATRVIKSSIKKDQTVYAKPTKLTIDLDKPITSSAAELKVGDEAHPIEVSHTGSRITIVLKKPLKREAKYTMRLNDIEATDGSTLADPYILPFNVSGGPKVTSVSVGTSRIDPNARIVIGFDQELSDKQNIGSLVSLKGGAATVTKINSRQVAIQLSNLGRCRPFTLSVAGGVLSKYDIKNSAGWGYNSRTICYTTSVYGTSLDGRPLVAYYFGNSGPVTLYTGAIHGSEVSSKYMMESWISELEANANKIGERRIVVIPSINPDGVAAGTRNNSRNVNLSRNFPTDNWVSNIDDTNGPLKGGGGKKPLSEPESAALANLVQQLRPRLLLSYHAVGSLVVGDPGGFSASKASSYARSVGYRDATGAAGTFDYDITGSFEDWSYRNAGVPSMVIELGSYSYHDFGHHRSAMWSMLD